MLSGIASFGRSYQDVEHMKGVRPSTGLVERRGRSEKAEESRRRLKKVEEGWCCHVITHMYMHAIMVTCHVFIYYDKHSIPTEANSAFGHRISVFRHLELREVKGTCEHTVGGRLEAGWRQAGGRLEAACRQAGSRRVYKKKTVLCSF